MSATHLDIVVENTGNATAFAIEITFNPPFEADEKMRENGATPLQRISILKPGQALQSYFSKTEGNLERRSTVTISWRLHPTDERRETLSYLLNMADYEGVIYLGSRNPAVQIAEQLKELRDDWKRVAKGESRIKADTFVATDRQRERELMEERHRRVVERSPTPNKGE